MSVKKIPMRMCTGCHEMKPKKELIRVVKTPEGDIKVDFTGKLNGRGAYLCKSAECFLKAQKQKALSRAFECQIADEIYEDLRRSIEKGE
ncbi:MAG: YlxR family protein [Clostridia bacterium]|nr:YlxR family protein [Clostridia bacterium]MBQ3057766.1 YlxR family protein [Clostridia bacterium]